MHSRAMLYTSFIDQTLLEELTRWTIKCNVRTTITYSVPSILHASTLLCIYCRVPFASQQNVAHDSLPVDDLYTVSHVTEAKEKPAFAWTLPPT